MGILPSHPDTSRLAGTRRAAAIIVCREVPRGDVVQVLDMLGLLDPEPGSRRGHTHERRRSAKGGYLPARQRHRMTGPDRAPMRRPHLPHPSAPPVFSQEYTHALAANIAPYRRCSQCPNKARSRGMCQVHYSRWYHAQRSAPDPIAVERACLGDPPRRLTRSETRAAIAQLDNGRRTARQIAQTIQVSQRTVERHRAARRAA